jgi:hypothetical protein
VQIVEGIPNVTGIQLDVTDNANLFKRVSQVQSSFGSIFCRYLNCFFRKNIAITLLFFYCVLRILFTAILKHFGFHFLQVDVVISLLPPSCHIIVADACIQVLCILCYYSFIIELK